MKPFAGRSGFAQRPRRGCRETSFPEGRSAARARTFLAAKDFFAPANWGRTAVVEAMACIVLCRGWCVERCSVLLCRGGRGPTAYTPILQVFPAATISQAGQSDAREVPFGSKDRTYRRYFGTNPNIARATTSGNFFSPAQHQSYHSFSRGRCSGRFFNEAPAGKSTSRVGPGSPPTPRSATSRLSSGVIDVSCFTSSDARGASSSSTRGSPTPLPWAPP